MSNIQPRELTMEEIEKLLGYKVKLVPKKRTKVVNIPDGEVFSIGETEFVVLKGGVKVLAIAKEAIGESLFDTNYNSYANSKLQTNHALHQFRQMLIKEIGEKDLLMRRVDLLSDNGFYDYGSLNELAAPMTIDEFKQYSAILENHKLIGNWWLATPHGTWEHNQSQEACYITPDNMIEHAKCDTSMKIRPMICLNCSTIVGYNGSRLN